MAELTAMQIGKDPAKMLVLEECNVKLLVALSEGLKALDQTDISEALGNMVKHSPSLADVMGLDVAAERGENAV